MSDVVRVPHPPGDARTQANTAYLRQHRVAQLFDDCARFLMHEKPADAVQALVDFLAARHFDAKPQSPAVTRLKKGDTEEAARDSPTDAAKSTTATGSPRTSGDDATQRAAAEAALSAALKEFHDRGFTDEDSNVEILAELLYSHLEERAAGSPPSEEEAVAQERAHAARMMQSAQRKRVARATLRIARSAATQRKEVAAAAAIQQEKDYAADHGEEVPEVKEKRTKKAVSF